MVGTKLLCMDLSICSVKFMMSPGIKQNTDSMEKIMALVSTRPRSGPMPYSMNMRAIIPATVVRELDDISGIAFSRALIMAGSAS